MNRTTRVPLLLGIALVALLVSPCAITLSLGEEKPTKEEKKAARLAKRETNLRRTVMGSKGPEDLPPLPEIGNRPLPPTNRQLQLTDAQIKSAANGIDSIIRAKLSASDIDPNPPASDEIFVRRLYLDITGRIPTPQETESFLKNTNPNKRARLIDHLLLSDGYRSHQFNWIADMVRYKSNVKRAQFASFQRWIKDSLRTNKGWDKMAYEMISAEGSLASNGASGYLLRDAGMPLDGLSNTLSLFLGANVSCAQCHDHPLAEWTQLEFYEMAAFFGATDVSYRDPRKIGNKIKDKNLTKQDGIAVAAPNMYRVKNTGENDLVIPEDYAYSDADPGDAVEPYLFAWHTDDFKLAAYDVDLDNPDDYRKSFAKWMTHPDNPRFAISIANRLWQKMFGIAVLEPIENTDDLDKASNPELLRKIGKIMVQLQFDMREFQRIVFNTHAYQAEANSTPAMGDIVSYPFSGPVLRRMTAEQAWDSIMFLGFGPSIDEYLVDRSHRATRMAFDFDEFSEAAVKQRVAEAKAKGYINNPNKFLPEDLLNPDRNPVPFRKTYYLRASELPQPGRDEHFLRMFGQSTRDIADDGSLEGNIPQTLMLMNGEFQQILTDPDSPLMTEVKRHNGYNDMIQSLYINFYSREPSQRELRLIRNNLKKDSTTIEELAWTLFNTPEFLFIQ